MRVDATASPGERDITVSRESWEAVIARSRRRRSLLVRIGTAMQRGELDLQARARFYAQIQEMVEE